jgi:hypothetical protein
MTEVEIFWPAAAPTTALHEAEDLLAESGVQAVSRLQPTRRGAELSVLVFIATSAAEPLLKALFQNVGDGAYGALQDFVRRLLGRKEPARPAPVSVLFRSATTGAQFVFTSNLPEAAFQQAIALDPAAGSSTWVWDQAAATWLRLADGPSGE